MATWNGAELAGLTLLAPRLTLRPFTGADAAQVYAAFQEPSMHGFVTLPSPYTEVDAQVYVQQVAQIGARTGTGFELALTETSTGTLVGAVSLRLPPERRTEAEIGYAVYPCGQGHRYAAEASRAVTGWAFEHGVARVVIRVAVQNLASIRTALAAGFAFEGVARSGIGTASGQLDNAVFARLPADSGAAVPAQLAPLPIGGLSDGVVGLRVLLAQDAAALSEQHNDVEALRWSFTGAPLTPAEAQTACERAQLDWLVGRQGSLAILDVASGEMAGSLKLRQAGPPGVGGIGYGLRPGWRGRGYTARALRLVRDWALGDGGFNRLELGAKSANIASQKVAIAAGFTSEGTRIGRLRDPDGSYCDEVRFATWR